MTNAENIQANIDAAQDAISVAIDALQDLAADLNRPDNAEETLLQVQTVLDNIESAEWRTVAALRAAGTTWQVVGDGYEITRQAAHERFSPENWTAPALRS